MNDCCSNGKSEAGNAPASKEISATIQPAAMADGFNNMEKLPRFSRTQPEYPPRGRANQDKESNEQRARGSILDRLIGTSLFAAWCSLNSHFRLAPASAAGARMKAVRHVLDLCRTIEQRG